MGFDRVFDFEHDSAKAFQCIPMAVRYKLDCCGIKLSRRQWRQFTDDERRSVLLHPCETARDAAQIRDLLAELIASRTGEQAVHLPVEATPSWASDIVPEQIVAFSRVVGIDPPAEAQWQTLSVLQRFTLVKLSGEGHDNENFIPALREFAITGR